LLRRALWLAFSLFPVWSGAAILAAHDIPVWKSLLAAGVPPGIVEGIRVYWWPMYGGLVVAHYFFIIAHPMFNRTLQSWKVKGGWAAVNLMFYPLSPPLYAWFGTREPE
jgi:hypothetical protein